jgi:hypothetical protein
MFLTGYREYVAAVIILAAAVHLLAVMKDTGRGAKISLLIPGLTAIAANGYFLSENHILLWIVFAGAFGIGVWEEARWFMAHAYVWKKTYPSLRAEYIVRVIKSVALTAAPCSFCTHAANLLIEICYNICKKRQDYAAIDLYIWLLDNLVKTCSLCFGSKLPYAKYAHLKRPLPKGNFKHVPFLDIVRSLGALTVDGNVFCIARIICNRTTLDDTRYLQKLIKAHFLVKLVLERFACAENGTTGCCDLNNLTRAGVSAVMCGNFLNGKRTEAQELYRFACNKCITDSGDYCINSCCCLLFGQFIFLCDLIDQLCLVHLNNPPKNKIRIRYYFTIFLTFVQVFFH